MAVTWKKLAFYDEVAILSDTPPESVGTTPAQGTATDASRQDHVHDLGAGCVDAANLFAAGVVDTTALGADAVDATKLADDAVGSEHIEALSEALDCAGQQLTDAVLENNAADPATPVIGKVYFKTGDVHPYICTVAA